MILVAWDWHTRSRQIALLDTATGKMVERRLERATGEAQRFYTAPADPAIQSDAPRLPQLCAGWDEAEQSLEKLYARWTVLEEKNG